jgi:ATP-dependent Clp protease ATP-binding subunit ClpC
VRRFRSPRAPKKVLELSYREALQLGHSYIGTEHILLGLIREGEGVAAQVLVKLGADLDRVRQQVFQLLTGFQGTETVRGEAELPADTAARTIVERLDRIEHTLTQMAETLDAMLRRLDRPTE